MSSEYPQRESCDVPGDASNVAGSPQKLSDVQTLNQTNVPRRDDAAYIALEIALEGANDARTCRLIREALQLRLATLESEPPAAHVLEGP